MSEPASIPPPAGPVPPKPPDPNVPPLVPPPAPPPAPAPASPPRLPRRLRRAQREMRQAMFKRLRRFYIRVLILFFFLLLIPTVMFRNHIYWTLSISGRESNAFRRAAWDCRIYSEPGPLLDRIRDELNDPDYAEKAIRNADVPFWLKGHAPEVRRAFVEGLGFLPGNPAAPEALRRLLEDPSVSLRPDIALALARHRDASDAPRFEALLAGDGPVDVRAAAARALGIARHVPSIPVLRKAVKEFPDPVAIAAVKALGDFSGNADAVRIVTEAGESPSRGVRLEALSAASLLAIGGDLPEGALDALLGAGRARLGDSDPGVRQAALSLLGTLRDVTSLPAFIRIYASRDPALTGTAAQAIVSMGSESVPAVRKALAEAPPDLRREMVWLLGRILHPASVELLLDLLRDSDPYVRQRANILLESLTGHKDIYFDYNGPPAEREEDEALWRSWWRSNASSVRLIPLDREKMIPPTVPKRRPPKP